MDPDKLSLVSLVAMTHMREENRQLEEKVAKLKAQLGSDSAFLLNFFSSGPLGTTGVAFTLTQARNMLGMKFDIAKQFCTVRFGNLMDQFDSLVTQDMTPGISAQLKIWCACHDPHIMSACTVERIPRT
jgi:hypothetical protein